MPSELEYGMPNEYQPPEEAQLQQHWKNQQRQMLEQKLGELQQHHPQWWTYSDTLGERPIDGMIRQIIRLKEEEIPIQDAIRGFSPESRDQFQYNQNTDLVPGTEWNRIPSYLSNDPNDIRMDNRLKGKVM